MRKTLTKLIAPLAAKFFFERPAQRRGYDEHRANLEKGSEEIKSRIQAVDASAPSEKTVKMLRHIIAIERWGQNRMALFFVDDYAEDVVSDENYDYKPEKDLPWETLAERFGEARAKTIEIARRLESGAETKHDKIPQNDFGPLTAKAWLQYLNTHANFESKRIK